MSNMFGQQYGNLGSQSGMNGYAQDENMEGLSASPMGASPMDASMMGSTHSQTLDQIINQNNQEMLRRRQTYQPRHRSSQQPDHNRRSSMLEFGSSNPGDLADFQFDPNPQSTPRSDGVANMMPTQKALDPRRVRSRDDLSFGTPFSAVSAYNRSNPQNATYPPALMQQSSAGSNLDASGNFMTSGVDMTAEFDTLTDGTMNGIDLGGSDTPQQAGYSASPMSATFPLSYTASNHDPGGPGGGAASPQNNPMVRMAQGLSNSSSPQRYNKPQQPLRRGPMMPSPLSLSAANSMSATTMPSPARPMGAPSQPMANDPQSPFPYGQTSGTSAYPDGSWHNFGLTSRADPTMNQVEPPPQPMQARYSSAYSTTGFDMLGVLMRVATRRNPRINIGPVDLSCAFVVCDIEKHDLPIVYCSDMFERLTGYSRHEILGRNCRFLQAPDGKVQSGVKRRYVDDQSVLYLKNQISKRQEAQLSLINYRKGGQPFMNLLTMIPVSWDKDELKFFVGFQVDLVEQPNSVSATNPDGTYEINYNRSALPAYRLPAPDPTSILHDIGGQTISRDEVSQVLATIGNGETELSKRIWDKILLENSDDVVHVLSLKGLFLYLSPACKTTLEYDPAELVGTALSSVCHPSDIVPVTRELKDSSTGAAVNVVYRIRRKQSGYTWFEAHGCLHTEPGKGRKCIILVGRQRPVYALDRSHMTSGDGVGDAELWSKVSTTGMFLYVSSSARTMLDRLPEDLVGTSMQALMRSESRKEFGRVLEVARMGEKSTFKHDLQNRRGQVLQAQTTVYPGDARSRFKPTFLLAQTRLLKLSRAMLLGAKSTTNATPRSDVSMGADHVAGSAPPATSAPPAPPSGRSTSTSQPLPAGTSPPNFVGNSGILTQAGSSGVPIGTQDEALASESNIFDELKTTRSTSWQFELRQMERQNRLLVEELQALLSRKKKRKRRKGLGNLEKDCANCHTRVTPEWRRGPSGQRDLCNSCGLRWAKQQGRVSPRKTPGQSDKSSTSPARVSHSNPSNSKETTGETETTSPAEAAGHGGRTPVQGQLKREESLHDMGGIPSVIDEGQEPPHPNNLPI